MQVRNHTRTFYLGIYYNFSVHLYSYKVNLQHFKKLLSYFFYFYFMYCYVKNISTLIWGALSSNIAIYYVYDN